MKNNNKIVVTPEERKEMVEAIKIYFSEEQGEEIGDLKAILILNFIIDTLAPAFYNKGVTDSYRYMRDMVEDVLSIQKW